MKIIIITGAPAIGKTALLPKLAQQACEKTALLDGDDLARIAPFEFNLDWLNLVQDNAYACAKNCLDFGVKNLFFLYCLPTQERLDRIKGLFQKLTNDIEIIALIANDKTLTDRNISRGAELVRDKEDIDDSLYWNNRVKELKNVKFVDTSELSLGEVAYEVGQVL